jgi:hypothetical protein
VDSAPAHVQLEVPRFGEFARQQAAVSTKALTECLALQRAHGGRLGGVMVRAGCLSPEQVSEILRVQARWVARMRSHDMAPRQFPLSDPLSLCLPCYNEAEVIEEVLFGACAVLPEFLDEFEIVVVDDGSTDGTAAVVERIARRNHCVRLVRHERNRGYGAAVATALRAAQGEWICFTDGDGQFNLLDLPQLLVHAQNADVAVGYRHRRADNVVRRLNAYGWNWLIRCLVGLRVRDLDCAFKLFPRWVVDRLELTAHGACISAQILAQCVGGGLAVSEVPVNHFPRSAGKATGANLRVIAKAFRELSVVWQYRGMSPWNVERDRHSPRRRETSTPSHNGVAPRRKGIAPVGSELPIAADLVAEPLTEGSP